jgi:hypothetical protein
LTENKTLPPGFLTQNTELVEVLVGYEEKIVGAEEVEVVKTVPTIETVQTDFDKVQIGSEFTTLETRLFQTGFFNPETGVFRKHFIDGEDYNSDDLVWPGKASDSGIAGVGNFIFDGQTYTVDEMRIRDDLFFDVGEVVLSGNEMLAVMGAYTGFDTPLDPDNPQQPLTQPGTAVQSGNLMAQQDAYCVDGPGAPIGSGLSGSFSLSGAALDASLGSYELLQNQNYAVQVEDRWSAELLDLPEVSVPFQALADVIADHNNNSDEEILTWAQYEAKNPSDADALIMEQTGYVPHFEARFFDGFSKTIQVPVEDVTLNPVLPPNFADLTLSEMVSDYNFTIRDNVRLDLDISDQINGYLGEPVQPLYELSDAQGSFVSALGSEGSEFVGSGTNGQTYSANSALASIEGVRSALDDLALTAVTTDTGQTVLGKFKDDGRFELLDLSTFATPVIDAIQFEEQTIHKQYFDFWIDYDAIGGTLFDLLNQGVLSIDDLDTNGEIATEAGSLPGIIPNKPAWMSDAEWDSNVLRFGVDYNLEDMVLEDLSSITAFTEAVSAQLALDGWSKEYAKNDGRGLTHRTIEGTPTVNLYEPEWFGGEWTEPEWWNDPARQPWEPTTTHLGSGANMRYVESIDSEDVVLDVPKGWFEHHVTTIGNDERNPTGRALQPIGNTQVVDTVVGEKRDTFYLQYTQNWSQLEEIERSANPSAFDEAIDDYDNYEAAWTVEWIDPLAFTQYSIDDGRSTQELVFNGGGLPGQLFGFSVEDLSILQQRDKPDWDMGPPAEVNADGRFGPSGDPHTDIFGTGGNWRFSDEVMMGNGFTSNFSSLYLDTVADGLGGEGDLADGEMLATGQNDFFALAPEALGPTFDLYELSSIPLRFLPQNPVYEDLNGNRVHAQLADISTNLLAVAQPNFDLTQATQEELDDLNAEYGLSLDAESTRMVQDVGQREVWRHENEGLLTSSANFVSDTTQFPGNLKTDELLVQAFRSGWEALGQDFDYYYLQKDNNEQILRIERVRDEFTEGTWSWTKSGSDWIATPSSGVGMSGDAIFDYFVDAANDPNISFWGTTDRGVFFFTNAARTQAFEIQIDRNGGGDHAIANRSWVPDSGEIDQEFTDSVYKLQENWTEIEKEFTEFSFLAISDPHSIDGYRPRYETIETLAQIIVKEWQNVVEIEPVYEFRPVNSTDVVYDTSNLDLSVFDLQTLTASNDITLNAGRDALVEGNIKAFGEGSLVSLNAGRDIDLGRPEERGGINLPDDVGLADEGTGFVDRFTVIESGRGLQVQADRDVRLHNWTDELDRDDDPETVETEVTYSVIIQVDGLETDGFGGFDDWERWEWDTFHGIELTAGGDLSTEGIVASGAGVKMTATGDAHLQGIVDAELGIEVDADHIYGGLVGSPSLGEDVATDDGLTLVTRSIDTYGAYGDSGIDLHAQQDIELTDASLKSGYGAVYIPDGWPEVYDGQIAEPVTFEFFLADEDGPDGFASAPVVITVNPEETDGFTFIDELWQLLDAKLLAQGVDHISFGAGGQSGDGGAMIVGSERFRFRYSETASPLGFTEELDPGETITVEMRGNSAVFLFADGGHILQDGGLVQGGRLETESFGQTELTTRIDSLGSAVITGPGDYELLNFGDMRVQYMEIADGLANVNVAGGSLGLGLVYLNVDGSEARTHRFTTGLPDFDLNPLDSDAFVADADHDLEVQRISADGDDVQLLASGEINRPSWLTSEDLPNQVPTSGFSQSAKIDANNLEILAAGDVDLKTNVNALNLRTLAVGDVRVIDHNTNQLHLVADVLDGSIELVTLAELFADSVVLQTGVSSGDSDDDLITDPIGDDETGSISETNFLPSNLPNRIRLQTSIGSGSDVNLGEIRAGAFYADEAAFQAARTELIQDIFRGVDPTGLDASVLETLPDESGVEVALDEQQVADLVARYQGETPPHGVLSALLAEQLVSALRANLLANNGDDADAAQRSLDDLLQFAFEDAPRGNVNLYADGRLVGAEGIDPHIVAAIAERMEANDGVENLRSSLERILNLEVLNVGSIDLTDIGGGFGRQNTFLDLDSASTASGHISVEAADNIAIRSAQAGGASSNLNLQALNGLVQITPRSFDLSLINPIGLGLSGDGNLSAGGDVNIQGEYVNLGLDVASSKLDVDASEGLSNLGRAVNLATDELVLKSPNTIALNGDPNQLSGLDLTSDHGVTLLQPAEQWGGFKWSFDDTSDPTATARVTLADSLSGAARLDMEIGRLQTVDPEAVQQESLADQALARRLNFDLAQSLTQTSLFNDQINSLEIASDAISFDPDAVANWNQLATGVNAIEVEESDQAPLLAEIESLDTQIGSLNDLRASIAGDLSDAVDKRDDLFAVSLIDQLAEFSEQFNLNSAAALNNQLETIKTDLSTQGYDLGDIPALINQLDGERLQRSGELAEQQDSLGWDGKESWADYTDRLRGPETLEFRSKIDSGFDNLLSVRAQIIDLIKEIKLDDVDPLWIPLELRDQIVDGKGGEEMLADGLKGDEKEPIPLPEYFYLPKFWLPETLQEMQLDPELLERYQNNEQYLFLRSQENQAINAIVQDQDPYNFIISGAVDIDAITDTIDDVQILEPLSEAADLKGDLNGYTGRELLESEFASFRSAVQDEGYPEFGSLDAEVLDSLEAQVGQLQTQLSAVDTDLSALVSQRDNLQSEISDLTGLQDALNNTQTQTLNTISGYDAALQSSFDPVLQNQFQVLNAFTLKSQINQLAHANFFDLSNQEALLDVQNFDNLVTSKQSLQTTRLADADLARDTIENVSLGTPKLETFNVDLSADEDIERVFFDELTGMYAFHWKEIDGEAIDPVDPVSGELDRSQIFYLEKTGQQSDGDSFEDVDWDDFRNHDWEAEQNWHQWSIQLINGTPHFAYDAVVAEVFATDGGDVVAFSDEVEADADPRSNRVEFVERTVYRSIAETDPRAGDGPILYVDGDGVVNPVEAGNVVGELKPILEELTGNVPVRRTANSLSDAPALPVDSELPEEFYEWTFEDIPLIPYLHGLDTDDGRFELDEQSVAAARDVSIKGTGAIGAVSNGQFIIANGVDDGLGLLIEDTRFDASRVDTYGLLRSVGTDFTFGGSGLGGETGLNEPSDAGVSSQGAEAEPVESEELFMATAAGGESSDTEYAPGAGHAEAGSEEDFLMPEILGYEQSTWEPSATVEAEYDYAPAGIDVIARDADYKLRSLESSTEPDVRFVDSGQTEVAPGPDLVTEASEMVATVGSTDTQEDGTLAAGPVTLSERLQTTTLKAVASVAGLWRKK